MNFLMPLLVIVFIFNVCLIICKGSVRAEGPDIENVKKLFRRHMSDKLPLRERIVKNKHYFQDIFVEQPSLMKISFGHVFEDPRKWEQRFESNDMENKKFQGKVRWGSEDGNYGEHYWDLNH